MKQEMERVFVSRGSWLTDSIEIQYGMFNMGHWCVAQPAELKRLEEVGAVVPPMITMSGTAAQRLMDELWNVGIRPTEGTGSAGSLAATERHLADMRRIALQALEKQGVIRDPVEVTPGPVRLSE